MRPEPLGDRVHEPVDDPRWRESYYFSFFDPELGIGGFSSIGKRPAKGHAGFINVVWGPEMPTLIASEFDSVSGHHDVHSVAGLSYAAAAPFGAWTLAFAGRLNDGGAETECPLDALGPVSRSPRPKRDVEFSLTFEPDHEPYLYAERDEWRDLFDGHVDEVGDVSGEISIDGETHAVRGRGGKDHSWGVRDWFKPLGWRWVDAVGAGGPELVTWRARFDSGWIGDGALYADGATSALTAYEETVKGPRRPEGVPAGVEISAGSDDALLELDAEVVRVVPILFRGERDGQALTSWNDRALCRCARADGSTAWANVEFETLLRGSEGE